jgi:hypothetical protein
MVSGTLSHERRSPVIELVSSLACVLVLLLGPSLSLGHALPVTTIVDRIPAGSRGAS